MQRIAYAVPVLLTLSCGGNQTVLPDAPSVVLIVVDTLRADHLGLYGYDRPTSPTLDAWAAEGRVFEHAFAPSPWTLPSFASLYTGRWPLVHQAGRTLGVADDEDFVTPGIVEYLPTVTETLQAAGMRTMAVANNPYLSPAFGMARGFDVYDFDPEAEADPHRSASDTVHRALELVDEVAGQPFFLVVHFFEPHMTYSAPPPFRDTFTASVSGSTFTLPITTLHGLHLDTLSVEDWAFVTAAYDEEIAYTDQQLGVLRDGLAARGLLDTSVVIFTADHGEELFEHGDFEHAHALWQEIVHVPLVVWGPGVVPGRDTTPVSLVDIAPTVLDAVDLAWRSPWDGVSLWPTLSAGMPVPDRPLFAEGVRRRTPQTAVVRWPQKLVVHHAPGRLERFDLEQDPNERFDLSGPARTLVADVCRHQQAGEDSTQAPAAPGEAVIEQLRSLGYLRGPAVSTSFLEDRQFPCYSDTGWGAIIKVRWVETVGDTDRAVLERELGLERAEHDVETTWQYRVPDASQDRLRAIVSHPQVEDTQGFDRATLELDAR